MVRKSISLTVWIQHIPQSLLCVEGHWIMGHCTLAGRAWLERDSQGV